MAREFSYGYVYYKSLAKSKKGGHKKLYKKAVDNLLTYGKNNNEKANVLQEVVSKLQAQSKNEYEKEKKILALFDGKFAQLEAGNWKEIIKAFNKFFQFEEDLNFIIEEIKSAQQNTKNRGKGNLDKFQTVFKSKVSEELTRLVKYKKDEFAAAVADGQALSYLTNGIEAVKYELIARTLESLEGNEENSKDRQKERFKYLLEALRDREKGVIVNTLVEQIYKTYNLDSFLNQYLGAVAANKGGQGETVRGYGVHVQGQAKANAGFLEEILKVAQTGLRGEVLISEKRTSVRLSAANIDKNVGSDFLIGINMSSETLNKIAQGMGAAGVGKAERVEQISQQMKSIKKAFYLIHVSSKLYDLPTLQKRLGYHTTDMSLATLESVLSMVPRVENIDRLIYTILQTPVGAIGDGLRGSLDDRLAQYFAQIFFDDVKTIGEAMGKKARGAMVHLVDLNGIYFPLSYLLDTMATAIQKYADGTARSYKSVVNVHIKKTTVLYPEGKEKTEDETSLWKKQADHAYQNITITTHFLKNIQQIVQEMFPSG